MDPIGEETLKRMDTASFYNDVIFSHAQKYIHGNILEVGCGIGSFTEKLTKKGVVTAIDINKEYISKSKEKFERTSTVVGFGDIEKGKYFFSTTKKFDSIICLNVLEHINDDKAALKNMFKLLKKDGTIFLLTPAHPLFYGSLDKNLGHERRYKLSDLVARFKESGFNIHDKYYFNSLGGLGWFANSRILRREIIPSNQLKLFVLLSRLPLSIERYVRPPFGLSCVIIASK